MRRFLIGPAFLICACGGTDGAQGPAGPEGPPGDAGTLPQASIATVLPRTFVLGHDTDIEVIGSLTSFTGNEKLDFGPGVTVSPVSVISPSALSAHVTVATDAMTGPRDLKLDAFTAMKVVSVVPGMDLVVKGGSPVQGGFVDLGATDLDPAQLFNQPHFLGGPQLDISPQQQGVTAVDYLSIIAPLAPPGPAQAQLGNYALGDTSLLPLYGFYSDPGVLNVTARAATNLTVGTPLKGQSLATTYDSGVFKVTTNGTAQVLSFSAAAGMGSGIGPFAVVFGSSGTADSYLTDTFPAYLGYLYPSTSLTIPVAAMPETFYFTVGDAKMRGGSGYGYDVVAAAAPATVAVEQMSPHGQGADQIIGAWSNPTVITGSLNGGDLDAYDFSALLPYSSWPATYQITVRTNIDNIEVGFPIDTTQMATSYLYGPAITPAAAPPVQKHVATYAYYYGGNKALVVRSGSAKGSRTPVGTYSVSIYLPP